MKSFVIVDTTPTGTTPVSCQVEAVDALEAAGKVNHHLVRCNCITVRPGDHPVYLVTDRGGYLRYIVVPLGPSKLTDTQPVSESTNQPTS